MDTKLTLKLDQRIIERAKTYAKKKDTSLSKLIENYLDFIIEPRVESSDVTPLVKSLSGIIDLNKNIDTKKDYKRHLAKKYSK
jgi:hypothetical protein